MISICYGLSRVPCCSARNCGLDCRGRMPLNRPLEPSIQTLVGLGLELPSNSETPVTRAWFFRRSARATRDPGLANNCRIDCNTASHGDADERHGRCADCGLACQRTCRRPEPLPQRAARRAGP